MDPILHNELTRRRGVAWQEVEARDARAFIVYATDGRGQNIRYLTNFSPIYGDALFVMTPRRHGYLLNFDWEIPRAREDTGLEEFTASFDLVGEVGSLEYRTERISSGSSTGTTAIPPSSGLPPSRTSSLKSVTCDPGMPPTLAAVDNVVLTNVPGENPDCRTIVSPPTATVSAPCNVPKCVASEGTLVVT